MAVAINVVVAAAGLTPVAASTPTQVAAPLASSTAAVGVNREVFGFALASSLADPTVGYPSWNFDLLTTVAFFGLHVGTNGQFVNDAGMTTWNSSALTTLVTRAHQHGVKVVLTVVLQDFSAGTPKMCAGLAHASATVTAAVQQVKAKGVDGVNIDYEGLATSCGTSDRYWTQHALTNFAAKMRSALGSRYYLSIDTYASSAADGYGFFDVAGLSRYVDSFFVMAYDMERSNYWRPPLGCSSFCLGPTSPLDGYYYNGSTVTSQYVAKVGAGKVIFGVPYYGRKACVSAATPNAYPTSTVVADSYLDAVGEATYFEVQPGSYAVHRDTRSSGMERWDTWFNTRLNCIRELYWDDVVSLGKKYDLVNSRGLRGVGIWNLNYGGGAPELWSALETHFARCASTTITAAPASPQGTGAQVALTAATTRCTNPEYRFWVQAPGGTWKVVRDYSPVNTYTWTGTGLPGAYRFEADSRSSNLTVTYDSVANLTYNLTACTTATLSADHTSPQRPGTTVGLAASAVCAGTPEYRFWLRSPGGAWTVVQEYGPAATYSWAPAAGAKVGTYGLEVDVRNKGATSSYEAVANMMFALIPACATPSLTTTPVSPQGPGAKVTVTAATSLCPNPRYRFWVLAPGSRWSMVQDYSASPTYSWNTAGSAAGTYQLEVDVRDVSSAAAYDAVAVISDQLQTCTSARISTSAASPQAPGTTLAISGAATCPGSAEYRFWIRSPGGSWRIVQDYGASSSYTWHAPTLTRGYYGLEVDVRTQGSTAAYDAVANQTFLIDACSAARLTSDRPSPQTVGTSIVLSASATCAGTPEYRFWVRPPGGSWTIVRDYAAASTYTWSTTGTPAGTYGLEVDVRDAGSGAAYETVSNLSFVLTA
ncbi:MAG TPA: glycosyl hydrolase family 18 protein [Candidatus Dormibacteraeota bacterium]|jgi:spore germination protein YaaH|nr:glycosyl hydrolase family 18 protein [Candidatus Dormibacteraeota bacterium]